MSSALIRYAVVENPCRRTIVRCRSNKFDHFSSPNASTWRVDPTILRQDPAQKNDMLGLEDFFYKSAQYKRWLLIPACVLFWLGVLSAALLVL